MTANPYDPTKPSIARGGGGITRGGFASGGHKSWSSATTTSKVAPTSGLFERLMAGLMLIALGSGVYGSNDHLEHRAGVAHSAKAASGWFLSISDTAEGVIKNLYPQSPALGWAAFGVHWAVGVPCGAAAFIGAGAGNVVTVVGEKVYDAFSKNK